LIDLPDRKDSRGIRFIIFMRFISLMVLIMEREDSLSIGLPLRGRGDGAA